ncbi:MAG TPA: phage holin family protein [Geminicoccaceae bacterium]|nr:phage holin family protein [Geminicoccaceae bacterium]
MISSEDRATDRSFTSLLSELSRDITTLFRKEIELARAETSEKVTRSFVAIGSIAGGAILALAALMVLLQALVIAIAELGVPAGWSSLIVGVVVAAIAYGLIQKGTNDLKAGSLAPSRTINSLKRDAQVAKEQVQ